MENPADSGRQPPTLRTLTFGCKVNQYETQYVRRGLRRLGYLDAEPDRPADLCFVNTCCVTGVAEAKSRRAIRRLARENPAARIIVAGCYATAQADQIARLPGVVEVLTDKRRLADWLAAQGVAPVPEGIDRFDERHRAFIKVQDGCRAGCSYCIIPQVRPYLESRPIEQVAAEARQLIDAGYRELVLTGIHLGYYGVDFRPETERDRPHRLADLVRRLTGLTGEYRIRISSIEAAEVTDELLEAIAEAGSAVCPHLHVCLQSGSPSVLRRMRRRDDLETFVARCEKIRAVFDRPALTTDVIVGFPGETEEEFHQTCETVERIGFSKIHVFPYSRREGTPAAELPGQLPPQEKHRRAAHLAGIEARLRDKYYRQLVGRRLQVLVEGTCTDGNGSVPQWLGTACRYAAVVLPAGDASFVGRLIDVRAERLGTGRIEAVACSGA